MGDSKLTSAASSQGTTAYAAFDVPKGTSFYVTAAILQPGKQTVETVEIYDSEGQIWQPVLSADTPVVERRLQARSGEVTIGFNGLGADHRDVFLREDGGHLGRAALNGQGMNGGTVAVAYIEWGGNEPR